ncbi:MAG TPA: molybdopterin cofactor-binding domain-containing protein [Thermodesulfobacteriota bacterium]|jgi:aldehyde oxidoreductase|nr:molybdopterin cofactor-binding domain-containing protein [Thermodesulfobacteriota bacterium]
MHEVNFILNGAPRRVIVDPQKSLLKVIREDLKLTGTKDGCSAGHCGTCAVLMDGEVVLSCRVPVTKAQGKEITTIEGIGTLKNPHPLQSAFAKTGAIQCGFCTPGMIVRAKSILDKNPDPSRDEIKKALQPHICRCTGYQKIFEAIELAASYLRGKTKSIELKLTGKGIIGQPVTRPDALEKATGTTLYAADITVDGCVYIKVLRSPHHHAKIVHIDKKEAEAIPGVLTVLTAEDVKGTNILKMAGDDQPVLCGNKVRFVGDPVAAVVATSEEIASYALEKIDVTFEPMEPVLTPEEALKEGAIKVHDDRANLFFEQPIIHGDVKKGFSESEVVVEKAYTTQSVEHAYLENDAGVAYIDENGKLIVMSASQNIHAHRKTIAEAVGLGLDKVRVIQTPTGGAFGGKLDVSVGGILGLAALKLKKPVKLVYTRSETFAATPKRHPFFMKVKVGAKKDGTLMALDFDLTADGGAYKSFSNSVTQRGVIHSQGPYRFPNANVYGKTVYTNTAFKGAMRGFGAPQVAFAIESLLDELAVELKMDPLALRMKNGFVKGDTTICGQVLDHPIGFEECMETLKPLYEKALQEAKAKTTDQVKRGVGLGGVWFGPGRSAPDQSEAWAELLPNDTLQVWIAASDMGQGTDTMFWQVAAETMGFPLERVKVFTTDTEITPDGNFSAGSRQTYVSGRAVQMAVEELKKAMDENGVKTYNEMKAKGLSTLYKAVNKPVTSRPDPKTGQGVPWETYSFGIQMAEVAVEVKTGKVDVLKITSVHDLGTVINIQNVEGQLHGGIYMGLGYALMEEFVYTKTDSFAKFRVPRAKDMPDIEVITLNIPRKKGPFGASGTAEYADVPTAPAIANAIYNACGARIRDLPITPEKIRQSL